MRAQHGYTLFYHWLTEISRRLPKTLKQIRDSYRENSRFYLNTFFRNHAKKLQMASAIKADMTPAIITSIVSMLVRLLSIVSDNI